MGLEGSEWDSRLERDFFISRIMVGDCPRCGGINTHDCDASEFDPLTTGSPENVFETGSECWAVRELDDPTIGHCDDCDYLWCIECGSQISVDERVCGHWAMCDECSSENGYMTLGEILEKVCPKCEHWDDALNAPQSENGKTLERPSLDRPAQLRSRSCFARARTLHWNTRARWSTPPGR